MEEGRVVSTSRAAFLLFLPGSREWFLFVENAGAKRDASAARCSAVVRSISRAPREEIVTRETPEAMSRTGRTIAPRDNEALATSFRTTGVRGEGGGGG